MSGSAGRFVPEKKGKGEDTGSVSRDCVSVNYEAAECTEAAGRAAVSKRD